jgi:hypothetical protein
VPWAVAAAFVIMTFVLLGMMGSLRQQANDLTQQLGDAQAAYADLQTEQLNLKQKLGRVETNYSARVADLQKQVVQKGQDLQRQKVDFESRFENRGNEFADAQKQLAVFRTRAAQDAAELDRLNDALNGVNSPNQNQLTQLRLGIMHPTPDGPSTAAGGAAWDLTQQKGLLVVEGLPPLPQDRDYQIWIVDANVPTPISGGVFRVNDRGTSRVEFQASSTVRTADRFAVSVERRGGTVLPQGRFVLTSK